MRTAIENINLETEKELLVSSIWTRTKVSERVPLECEHVTQKKGNFK